MPASTAIDPSALLTIKDLELRARVVMEGVQAGLHRSPFSGFSSEFTEYRQYSPGDDLRYLDWRAYARTDRFYLKKFEDETNLRCFILLDVSRSMKFGSRGYSKSEYANTFAATLACFLHGQRDVVGLGLFDQHVHDAVPPRWRPGHLQHIYASLSREPDGRDTALGSALQEAARLCRKRTLVVIISDFLAPVGDWAGDLGLLAAAHHDVRAVQILDPAEQALDFGTAAIWEDLETGATRYVDPRQARSHYLKGFNQHAGQVRATFDRHAVTHQVVATTEPLDHALLRFLKHNIGPGSEASSFGQEATS